MPILLGQLVGPKLLVLEGRAQIYLTGLHLTEMDGILLGPKPCFDSIDQIWMFLAVWVKRLGASLGTLGQGQDHIQLITAEEP